MMKQIYKNSYSSHTKQTFNLSFFIAFNTPVHVESFVLSFHMTSPSVQVELLTTPNHQRTHVHPSYTLTDEQRPWVIKTIFALQTRMCICLKWCQNQSAVSQPQLSHWNTLTPTPTPTLPFFKNPSPPIGIGVRTKYLLNSDWHAFNKKFFFHCVAKGDEYSYNINSNSWTKIYQNLSVFRA